MRIIFISILLLGSLHNSGYCQQAYKSGQKKLIEFGQAIPNYTFVADNIASMEYAPFEGITFDLRLTKQGQSIPWSLCNAAEVKESDLDFAKLRLIRSQKFTDNFIRVRVEDPIDQTRFSWFDDAIWTNINLSTRVLSKAVVASQAKGIFLDTEQILPANPWAYTSSLYPTFSPQTVYNKVRQRGREFMQALQSDAPQVKVLYLLGYGRITNWGSSNFYTQQYALLKPFLDGMLEAAGTQVTLIDGNKAGFWSHANSSYAHWYSQIKTQYLLDRVPPEFTAKYQKQYQAGSSLILNQHFNIPHGQSGFDFNYGLSLADQKKWAEHAVYNNLLTSDEYVWSWSQGEIDWWTKTTFSHKQDWIDAINSAKSKLMAGQSQGSVIVEDTNVKLKARFETGAAVATLTGPVHNSNIPPGNVTFNLGLADPTQLSYFFLYINSVAEYVGTTSKVKALTAGKYTAWAYGQTKDGKFFQSNPIDFTVGGGLVDTQAPSIPNNILATNITSTTATISWSASTDNVGVTGYDIFRDLAFVGTTSNTQYVLNGLNPNTSYAITLKARDAAGNLSTASPYYVFKTLPATDTQPPTSPTLLQASQVSSTGFTLNWSPSTDNVGVASYEIIRDGVPIGVTASTSFVVTGLLPNTNYSMIVRAKDAAGNHSVPSSPLNVRTLVALDTQAPTAPTALMASQITAGGFTVSWSASTDNVGVVAYEVYRNGTLLGSVVNTGFVFTGLAAQTSYSITIRAKDAAGNLSPFSQALVVITLQAPDNQPPSIPTGLTVGNISQTGFTISWSASTDNLAVTAYDIYRDGLLVTSLPGLNYTFTGLVAGTQYSVSVRAKDAAGNTSLTSAPVVVQTLPANMGGSPNCNTIRIQGGVGTIQISGMQAPVVTVQVFDKQWKSAYSCMGNCNTPTELVAGLSAGQHFVKVNYYDAQWKPLCVKEEYVQVSSSQTGGVLTFNTPPNITVQAAAGAQSAVVNYATPQASTTCSGGQTAVIRKSGAASGTTFAVGDHQICYTATDGCGNSKDVCFTVRVVAPQNNICDQLLVTGTGGRIVVSNNSAQNTGMQLFNNQWNTVATCLGNCNTPTHTFSNLAAGNYFLKIDLYNSAWQSICQKLITVVVTNNAPLQSYRGLTTRVLGSEIQISALLDGQQAPNILYLERKTDDQTFERIAVLEDIRAGVVQYTDAHLEEGVYTYRLTDGHALELLSMPTKIYGAFDLQLFPNPTSGTLTALLPDVLEDAALYLVRADGVMIQRYHLQNTNSETFDFTDLPSGVYYLQLERPGARTHVQKFVKIDH